MEFNSKIVGVLSAVNRKYFTSCATSEHPQPIGYNATISARDIHALTLHYLDIQQDDNVLDVGCGSGYLCAAFAYCGAQVTGVDHIPELVDLSYNNIKKATPHLMHSITLSCCDGRKGYPSHAPYDKINVGAACSEIYPSLIDQLKMGGKLFLPLILPDKSERMTLITKTENGFDKQMSTQVIFVPMTDKQSQLYKI